MPAMIVWPVSWSVFDAEGRVLVQRGGLEREAQLLLVGLGLRLDRDLDDRLRERPCDSRMTGVAADRRACRRWWCP